MCLVRFILFTSQYQALTEIARQPSHVMDRLIRIVTPGTVTLETITQQIQYHQDD